MATLPEDVNKSIKCCLSATPVCSHYAYEAILFSCGGNACRKCIIESDNELIQCGYCENEHSKSELLRMPSNPHVKQLMEAYMQVLKEEAFSELNEITEKIKEESIENDIELRFSNIEYELDARIESIITGLHEYRDKFKKEMDSMKGKYKKSVRINKLKEIKAQLDNLNRESIVDYEIFIKAKDCLTKAKCALQSYLNDLNQIKFAPTEKVFYKELVGELIVPLWKTINSTIDISIDESQDLQHFVYQRHMNKIIMSDYDGGRLFLLHLDDENSIETFKHESIKAPYAMCLGRDDELLVIDGSAQSKRVLVFDKNLEYQRQLIITCDEVDRINVDHANNYFYLTHCDTDKITVWKMDSPLGAASKITDFSVHSPHSIEFSKELIYVTSLSNYEKDGRITNGSNCVFVLNRSTFEVVDKIAFDNWLQPYGLSFDKSDTDNILTIAYEFDSEIGMYSSNTYLHVISKDNRELVNKIRLGDQGSFIDMMYFDNKLAILYKTSITIVEFVV